MKKPINLTQYKLIYNLYNDRQGSVKLGWTITHNKDSNFMSLHKLSDINQAHALAELMPDIFECTSKMFRLSIFKIKDLGPIPELLKYNSKYESKV